MCVRVLCVVFGEGLFKSLFPFELCRLFGFVQLWEFCLFPVRITLWWVTDALSAVFAVV